MTGGELELLIIEDYHRTEAARQTAEALSVSKREITCHPAHDILTQ